MARPRALLWRPGAGCVAVPPGGVLPVLLGVLLGVEVPEKNALMRLAMLTRRA